MPYRAILFDFDGTLTPSLPLWVKAFHIALGAFGYAFSDQELIARFFYRDWKLVVEELKLESVEVLQREIHRGLRESFEEAELFPEVPAILRACRARGLQIGLVTSAPRLVLDHAMPRLGIDVLFDHVVCADDVRNFKPHPEPVLASLSALRCSPHEAIMIGDSTADMLAGKAAGTATALFLTDAHADFHDAAALRATKPDHIFSQHRELADILDLTLAPDDVSRG